MRILGCLFFVAILHSAAAQGPEVPHKMKFADITLTIRDDARREIQKDVDALTQSPRHFNIKVERAKTYFPLIEKVFREEGVPDDFKFLVLQESALIPDAVSVSNAVGFWQFKDFTAMEMGLRVDKEIDERLNIVSSSRAAARYIKKNNTFFNNWIYALQAYQMGAGGVMRSVKDSQNGTQHMEVTSGTYWYVKKYLAHKIAFEDAVKGAGQIQVIAYENRSGKTLADLAKEVTVDEASLVSYNKWTKSGKIPDDRKYAVLIPVTGNSVPELPETVASSRVPVADAKTGEVTPAASVARAMEKKRVNGISVIQSIESDSPTKMAARAGVDLSMFLRWNDISISDKIPSGKYYLLGKKRTRATEAYHKVIAGETLWDISQQYGVQIKKLKRYNRIDSDNAVLTPGTTLWLNARKPKNSDATVPSNEVLQVDKAETFAWAAENAEPQSPVVIRPDATEEEKKREPEIINAEPVEVVQPPVQEVADSAKVLPTQTQTVSQKAADSVLQAPISVVVPETVIVPENKGEHIVQPKETLYGIAKQYNVAVMDLVKWNNLNLQEGIHPGQVLKLIDPQPASKDVTTTTVKTTQIEHEVKATDTLYGIARKYNVTIQELMEWNNKKNFSLTVGEKLKVIQK